MTRDEALPSMPEEMIGFTQISTTPRKHSDWTKISRGSRIWRSNRKEVETGKCRSLLHAFYMTETKLDSAYPESRTFCTNLPSGEQRAEARAILGGVGRA